MLGLYGTAIGAGTLFLPINAEPWGFWPLLVMTLLALPMTFSRIVGLTRFVLSGSSQEEQYYQGLWMNILETIGKIYYQHFILQFTPSFLIYSVAITNTVLSFIEYQLHIPPPPRILVSGVLILTLMMIVRSGKDIVIKTMSILVFPFVITLMGLALYLIPNWTTAIFDSSNNLALNPTNFFKTLWLAIPVMIFSFNHSPIISSFAVSQKIRYGEMAERKSTRILLFSHLMMVVTVMFFVFSCILTLSAEDLAAAKQQNISILSYLANHFNNQLFAYIAPLIAFIAISKSFFGHYLGANEGFNGLVAKILKKDIHPKKLDNITAILIGLSAWGIATLNPSILSIIESLGGPIIALLLFLMPMYAIYKVPAMRRYAGKLQYFWSIIGCIAISAIFIILRKAERADPPLTLFISQLINSNIDCNKQTIAVCPLISAGDIFLVTSSRNSLRHHEFLHCLMWAKLPYKFYSYLWYALTLCI